MDGDSDLEFLQSVLREQVAMLVVDMMQVHESDSHLQYR